MKFEKLDLQLFLKIKKFILKCFKQTGRIIEVVMVKFERGKRKDAGKGEANKSLVICNQFVL